MHVRAAAAQRLRHRLLVRGVAEREQEADGDRLGAFEVGQRADVERHEHPVRPDALAHAVAALERDERRRQLVAEPVQVRARLPPQVEQVLEALGGDERRPRALPFEQGVRGDRRPVREALDRLRADGLRGRDHRLFLLRGGGHLRRAQPVVIEQHGIGEGAADVDPEDGHRATISGRPGPPTRPPASASVVRTRRRAQRRGVATRLVPHFPGEPGGNRLEADLHGMLPNVLPATYAACKGGPTRPCRLERPEARRTRA